jgi:orotate phosphoribosyltransferase
MERNLLDLLNARRGHFRLESGYHGALWLDLDPLFTRPHRIRPHVEALAEKLRAHDVEAVCGPLVGGAFLAQSLATHLNIEFYYAERFAPPSQDGALYPVEYRIPQGIAGEMRGKHVAVVDDAISAGSAVRGTVASLRSVGSLPVAIGALLVLGNEAARWSGEQGFALEFSFQEPYELWLPADCPMCAAGEPLREPGAP